MTAYIQLPTIPHKIVFRVSGTKMDSAVALAIDLRERFKLENYLLWQENCDETLKPLQTKALNYNA
jgi:hypothetical protein